MVDGSTNTLTGHRRNVEDKTVILPIMKVKTQGVNSINVLWDTAADLSLVTTKKANDLELKGKAVKLSIVLAGGARKLIETEKYSVPIVTIDGKVSHITAF